MESIHVRTPWTWIVNLEQRLISKFLHMWYQPLLKSLELLSLLPLIHRTNFPKFLHCFGFMYLPNLWEYRTATVNYLAIDIVFPLVYCFKRWCASNIKNNKCSDSFFVVYTCHVSESLLSSDVPQLQAHDCVGVQVDHFQSEIYTNSCLKQTVTHSTRRLMISFNSTEHAPKNIHVTQLLCRVALLRHLVGSTNTRTAPCSDLKRCREHNAWLCLFFLSRCHPQRAP